jgi:hypothetical protein
MPEAHAKVHSAVEAASATDRKAALWIFAAHAVAMVATTFSPPLLRMYSTEMQLWSLAAAAGDPSLVLAPEAGLEALERIAPGVEMAYTVALARGMWVLAGLCILGAALVWAGLPGKREELGQEPA